MLAQELGWEGGRNTVTVGQGHRALFDRHMPVPQWEDTTITPLSRQEDQGPGEMKQHPRSYSTERWRAQQAKMVLSELGGRAAGE